MKRLAFFFLAVLCVCLLAAVGVNASATSASSLPYSGGTSIAMVLYPADGSTVTITTSGAVIKQSPNGSPYRMGWINPADIGSINSMADLNGRIISGSVNPYTVQNTAQMSVPTNSTNASTTASSEANVVIYRSQPTSVPQYSSSTSTSPPANYQTPSTSTTVQSSSTVPNQSANMAAAYTNPTSIPNTGPGNILAIGTLATIVSTVGHFFYQRLRNGY